MSSLSISKSSLKPKLLNYLRMVEHQKKSLVITDRGRPVAKVIPFTNHKKSSLDELKGCIIDYKDPLEPVGLDDWELK